MPARVMAKIRVEVPTLGIEPGSSDSRTIYAAEIFRTKIELGTLASRVMMATTRRIAVL